MTATSEISIDIFHLPSQVNIAELEEKIICKGNQRIHMSYPNVTAKLLDETAENLRINQKSYLSQLTVEEIISIIDKAAKKWTNPEYELRTLAEKTLPIITGYDALQISLELRRFIRLFRKKDLRRFIQSEVGMFGNILDDFQPNHSGGFSKFYGPDLIFQIFSGNVPGIQIWNLLMAAFVKSATLGKLSFAEAIMPSLFVKSLAEVDAKFADAIAILPWQSGTELENKAIELADTIIVCGGQSAVKSIKEKSGPTKKVLSYGYKIGLALIGQEAISTDRYTTLIKAVAEDISIYDQQNCLAPQSIFIEKGGAVSPKEFANLLASELQNYQLRYPRAQLIEAEQTSINKMRQQADIESIRDSTTTAMVSQKNTDWTIVYRDKVDFMVSPLNRAINIFAINNLNDIGQTLVPYRPYLQSAGIAVAPNRLFEMSDVLGSLGVNRISALGEMNHVVPGWHHDGGFNLLDLVHVTDIEASAERYSEQFDPDIE